MQKPSRKEDPMTTKELLYIKTVANEKNISRAAKKLFIAQPSLSQSLQRIEENLGAHLFNRTPSVHDNAHYRKAPTLMHF